MGDGALLLDQDRAAAPAPGARVARRPRRPAAPGDARAPEPGRGAGRVGEDEPARRVADRRGRGGRGVGVARRGRQRPGALLGVRVRGAARDGRRGPGGLRSRGGRARHVGRRCRRCRCSSTRWSRPSAGTSSCSTTTTSSPTPAVHEGVRFLLDHLPRAAHLVIATRTEPPVGISRLRARAELDEIASEQLRFNDAEAAALLNDTLALALPEDELAQLSAKTEGWAAGLYLAGLVAARSTRVARRRRPRLRPPPGRLPGRRGRLGPGPAGPRVPARHLRARPLLRAAVRRGARRGRVQAAARRDRARQPLPRPAGRATRVVSLPPRLPRRPAAGARGHRRAGRDIAELHARAGAWCAGAGDVSSAVGHLLAAGREAEAADLVATSWNAALQRGRGATVLRWLDALPPDVVTRDPRLCLARAWLALDSGEPVAAARWAAATAAADDGRALPDGRRHGRVQRGHAARDAGLSRR